MKRFKALLQIVYTSLMSKLQTSPGGETSSTDRTDPPPHFLKHLLCNDGLLEAGSIDELFQLIDPYCLFLNTMIPKATIVEYFRGL